MPDGYQGIVLARVVDNNNVDDYLHEGSGSGEDLTLDLMALGVIESYQTNVLNINSLSEILTRRILGDEGGDQGTVSVNPIVNDAPLTQEMIAQDKQIISEAFGLDPEVDINVHATQAVNQEGYDASSPESQAMAIVLATLAGEAVLRGGVST